MPGQDSVDIFAVPPTKEREEAVKTLNALFPPATVRRSPDSTGEALQRVESELRVAQGNKK